MTPVSKHSNNIKEQLLACQGKKKYLQISFSSKIVSYFVGLPGQFFPAKQLSFHNLNSKLSEKLRKQSQHFRFIPHPFIMNVLVRAKEN